MTNVFEMPLKRSDETMISQYSVVQLNKSLTFPLSS